MTEELDFQSQELELVTANHCFALVSQFSHRAFLEGRLDVAEDAICVTGMLLEGFDRICSKIDTNLAQATD